MRTSMFSKACEYIEYKRNLGFRCSTDSILLKSFGRYADIHAHGKPLSVKLAVEWATLPQRSRSYHVSRLGILRLFAKYLLIENPKTEMIPVNLLPRQTVRRKPYIYSSSEIQQLLEVDVNLRIRSIENLTFSSVIGLLTCTGMRISEVLALKCSDIDWKQQIISVRWSKKLPVRFLPIDKTVMEKLRKYERCRNQVFQISVCDKFFVNFDGKELLYFTFREQWVRALEKTGIGKTSVKRPRTHDLRHTFACKFLLQAYQKHMDMNIAVHLLSVYLGHSEIRDTYWYLTNIPDLMKFCCDRFEKHVNKISKGGQS